MLHEVGAAVAGTDGRLPATSNLTVNLSERVSAWGLLGYGRGLSLRLAPSLGAGSSGMDRL